MHPVGEVDIGVPRSPVHHFVARRTPAAGRMAGEVARPTVSLDLDDDPLGRLSVAAAVYEQAAEEISRHS